MAVEYRGARWYDGAGFVARTVWTDAGVFATSRPYGCEVVDLDGLWVVPPYGDAHVHWLEPDDVTTYVADHVRDGVLYVKDHATSPAFRDAIRPHLGPVSYVTACQGFTGQDAHPAGLVDLLGDLLPEAWHATRGDGHLFHAVSSESDVDRAWASLLAARPDFVKVFLVRSDAPGTATRERGIDPALVPGIVRRAQAAGLRVSAHVENAADFAVAVAAGVDDFAHLPFAETGIRLTDADVAVAGARGATVATTLEWLARDDPRYDVTRDNLDRLRASGVTVRVGTDLLRTTARDEADRIAGLGLMTNAELLRSWCVDTPRAVDPAAGSLEPGAGATFLALRGDPLTDFAATGEIELRVSRGEVVAPLAL